MLSLPIEPSTFKRDFLGGKGTINLDLPGGLAPTDPFPDSTSAVATGGATASTGDLTFGKSTGMAMTASLSAAASASIDLIRPDAQTDFAKKYNVIVPAGQIGGHLHVEGNAAGALSGSLPNGIVGFEFGIKAGANVFYDRFNLYDANTPAELLLVELVTHLGLPQHTGTPASIPLPTELLVFGYGGYLDLNAGLSWGYQITGHQGLEFNDLKAAIEYDLRLKASLNVGYKLAGNFEIAARAGSKTGWVALVVKKSSSSQFDFAAALQATGKINVTGLPQSADEFLIALLGADAKHALNLFQKVRDFTDLDKLQAATDKILLNTVTNLANKWLDKALDQANVTEFLGMLGKAVDEYNSVDDKIVNSVMHLYEDYVDQNAVQKLKDALTKIAGLAGKDDLANLSDSEAWQIINTIVGGDLAALLQSNTLFSEVTTIASRGLDFLNGAWQPKLRDLVDELKKQFHLDQIFGELAKFDNKDKLKNLADTKLQGVVEKLLGTTWDRIKGGDVGKAAKELQQALDRVNDFKNNWFQKVTKALNQSFNLSVNYAYTRATASDSLIDVEIDVSETAGQQLFDLAAHGNFVRLFDPANMSLVRVNQGVLTHQLTKSTQLGINVLGWEFKRIVDVISQTTNSVEVQGTGLINVFTTEASIKQRIEKKDYSLESNFLMRLIGEAARPSEVSTAEDLKLQTFLVKTVQKLGVSYDLAIADKVTKPAEMTHYLDLAEHLGLIPSASAMSKELVSQFPKGLGSVTVTYVVNYDGDGILDAFKNESGDKITALVTATARKLVSSHLINSSDPLSDMVAVGFAYRDPANAALFFTQGFPAFASDNTPVSIPAWFPSGPRTAPMPANDFKRQLLFTLYNIEASTAKRLVKLDDIIDRARVQRTAVKQSDLEEAARKFVEEAADLDRFGSENTFFGIFDAFIHEGSNGTAHRESTMILQITPAGATDAITKYLMAK